METAQNHVDFVIWSGTNWISFKVRYSDAFLNSKALLIPDRCAHPQLVQMETLQFYIDVFHKEEQCYFFNTVNYSGYLHVAHFC